MVKSHGGADALAFRYALKKAYAEAAQGVLERISQAPRRYAGARAVPVPVPATGNGEGAVDV